MKQKHLISLIILLVVIFLSCSKKNNENNTQIKQNEIYFGGRIIDTLGKGIGGIKIYYNDNFFITSNASGYWQNKHLGDSIFIEPYDSNFTFYPVSKKIFKADTTLVFTAHSLTPQNINAQHIYNWFTQMQLPNGLLESTENGNLVSLYDNALAALVFIAKKDYTKAASIFDFFSSKINSEMLSGTGGFSQFRDKNGIPTGDRWLGDNAWLLIAINNYKSTTNSNQYNNLANALENWIIKQQDTDGGIWGGYDNNGIKIGKITEGMIDAFNAVVGNTNFHKNLLHYLKINRWNTNDYLLMAYPNNKYVYAMDNHSWGYCAFEDYPYSVLQKAAIFNNTQIATVNNKKITGYCFDIDKDAIWLEGTGQMVVAFKKAGQTNIANFYLAEMEKLILPSNMYPNTLGLPYSSNLATHYGTSPLWVGADTKPCISSSAWYLFGYLSFNPMAIGYNKNIATSDRFW